MDKLFWIDMEMTGLNVDAEVIIEVAAIITDFDFRIIDTYEAVVKQPQIYIDNMDDWNREHHTDSGLIAKIPNGFEPDRVELNLIDLVKKHWPEGGEKPMLAGNSITQDRLFIARYFRKFNNHLHYRMLDVSSWKIVMQKKYNYKYQKANSHRALDDIKESIDELKNYCSFLNVPKAELPF
jgi:oligoribonuclease